MFRESGFRPRLGAHPARPASRPNKDERVSTQMADLRMTTPAHANPLAPAADARTDEACWPQPTDPPVARRAYPGRAGTRGLRPLVRARVLTALGVVAVLMTVGGILSLNEPSAQAGPYEAHCPSSVAVVGDGMPQSTRTGPVVPVDAVVAVLCTYGLPTTGDDQPLTSSQVMQGRPGRLVEYVNGLPEFSYDEDPSRPGEAVLTGCPAILGPTYRIVFIYGDGSAIVVRVNPNCGTVEHGGSVRTVNLNELLDFWK